MNYPNQDRIEKVVELDATVARVWQALTNHEEFGTWFRVDLDGPFEVGSTTTGQMTFPGAEDVRWESITEKLEHQRLFAFSWHPSAIDADTEYDSSAKVVVEFHLEPAGEGARLTIIETGFSQFPEKKRLDILRSNEEGWNIQSKNIAEHVGA